MKTRIRIALPIAHSVPVILLSILFIAAVASCSGKKQQTPPAAPVVRGSVTFLEGAVTIDGKPAEFGTELGGTASIETGPSASCEIIFDGKNVVKIMQNTVAILNFSEAQKEVQLQKGGIAAVLKKLETLSGQDSFKVRGTAAVAGVRGTTLCVWADAESTYVCACNGRVNTIDAKGANQLDLEASHHVARLYSSKDGAISVEAAGLLHHSDAGVEALASKIGYSIDWTKIE